MQVSFKILLYNKTYIFKQVYFYKVLFKVQSSLEKYSILKMTYDLFSFF